MSVDWKNIGSLQIKREEMHTNDFIRAIVIKEDWETILSLSETHSDLFLKILHINSVRKQIFASIKAEKLISLLDHSIPSVRTQMLQIMLENFEKNEQIAVAAKQLYGDVGKHPYAINEICSIVALLPENMLRNLFVNSSKGINKFQRITNSINGNVDTTGSFLGPSEFLSQRNITKRESILRIIFDIFEANIKKGETGFVETNIMNYIQFYAPSWKKHAALRAYITKIIKEADLSKIHCTNTYQIFISGIIPSPYHFDFALFIKLKIMKKEDFLKAVISVLAADAEQSSIRKTNLRRLISNIPQINTNLGFNLFHSLRSEAKENPNSKEGIIFARIEKEYQAIAAHRIIKYCDSSMLAFIAQPLINNSSLNNTINSINKILFKADVTLGMIKKTIEDLMAAKDTIVKESPSAYTDRMISVLHELEKILVYFDPEFVDKFIIEVIRHPTVEGRVNYIFEAQTIDSLICAMNMNDLKKISTLFQQKNTDEFGFLTKRKISFPPLQTSTTKKSEEYECTSIHPVEQKLIFSRLLLHQNVSFAQAARQCYAFFVNKVLVQAYSNPELCSRAAEMHFRFCRFCMRDDQDLIVKYIVSPLAIYANIQSGKNYIEQLLQIIPTSTNLPTILINLIYTKIQGIENIIDSIPKLIDIILPRVLEQPNCVFNSSMAWNMPSRNLQIRKNLVDHLEGKIYDLQYRHLIMKSFGKPATQNQYFTTFDESFYNFEAEEKTAPIQQWRNHVAAYHILQSVYTVAQGFKPYAPDTLPLNKMINAKGIADYIAHKITFIPLFRVPIVNDICKFAKENSTQAYSLYSSMNATLQLQTQLTEATAPFLKHVFKNSLLGGVSDYEDFFKMLNFFSNFDPYLTSYQAEKNQQLNKKPSIFKAMLTMHVKENPVSSFVFNHPGLRYVVKSKKQGNQRNQKVVQPRNDFYEQILDNIFKCDVEKTLDGLLKYPGSFVSFVGLLSYVVPHCTRFNGNSKVLSLLLNAIFTDLLTEDPKPTEEIPNPLPSETLFTKYSKKEKIGRKPKRGPRIAKQAAEAPKAMDKRFGMNVALIAKLCHIMRSPIFFGKIDHNLFTDSLISVTKLSPETIIARIGDASDNFHNFSAQLAQLYVSFLDFGLDEKSPEWAKTMPKQFVAFGRMLSIPVLLHSCLAAILEKMEKMQLVQQRLAVITALLSMTELSMHDESFAPGIAFRLKVISWALSPTLVGYPLPEASIQYIDRLTKNQNMNIDMCRTIISCVTAYFQQQSILNSGPYHFEELFASLQNMNLQKLTLITPHFCRVISRETTDNYHCEDILPKSSNPDDVVFDPIVLPIEMPNKGIWEPLHERICSTFIAGGLLSKNENIVQLTMKMMTKLSTAGSISKLIAPRITQLMNAYSPYDGLSSVLEFAISFVMYPTNAQFTEAIDSFIKAYGTFFTLLQQRAKELAVSIWYDSVDMTKFASFINIYNTSRKSIDALLSRANPENALYISKICKRLLEVSTSDQTMPIVINEYLTFTKFLKLASYPKLDELIKSTTFAPILEFLSYGYDELNHYNFTFANMICYIYIPRMDVEALKSTQALELNVAKDSVFLASATKELFTNLRERKVDIQPLIEYASRFSHLSQRKIEANFSFSEELEQPGTLSAQFSQVMDKNKKKEAAEREKEGNLTSSSKVCKKAAKATTSKYVSVMDCPELRQFTFNNAINGAFVNVFNF